MPCLVAQELLIVPDVELQPLQAQAVRVAEALELLGAPLAKEEAATVRQAPNTRALQQILDRHCLVGVQINPESRVKVQPGPSRPELVQQGWRTFLIKVENQAGITPVLTVDSPNAGQIPGRSEFAIPRRFLDLSMYNKQPMRERLSGLAVEYRILQIYSRDAGKREAKLVFSVGQGSQDLGFRSELDILFDAKPAQKITFRVKDEAGKPTTAGFVIRDQFGHVYPSQSKRLGADFFFHPQIYRADGESVTLPAGDYTISCTRGPEYRKQTQRLNVQNVPKDVAFHLKRWVDPAKLGWYSGDHHIHAAGCSHYERPTEGVYPQDMMRHIVGEDLKIGEVLSWGPGWYFQKTFFEGKDNDLSTSQNRMRYDVEVSGFPSSHTGHLVLLGLKQQDYPGTKRIEDWPSWGMPILRWAKQQGAVVGYAHSGWGLALKQEKLLTDEVPPFDGIGANEYIVSVTQGLPDFISTVDTPYAWELNIWYHTLNAGFRTRISGETDFPCIYDERVGLGRSYVKQTRALDYEDWVQGIREGRNYVSDGKSHLMNFTVKGLAVGANGSVLKLEGNQKLSISAEVAALLGARPDPGIRSVKYDEKPYWDLERARLENSQNVPVELIVNGNAVARKIIPADGQIRPVRFEYSAKKSSWVALRILPSSHTNPIFVVMDGKPIRPSRKSVEWCLRAVDECARQKLPQMRLSELGEATQAYEEARKIYRARLEESDSTD